MKFHVENKHLRWGAICGLAILLILFIGLTFRQTFQALQTNEAKIAEQVTAFNALLPRYEELNVKIDVIQTQGVDVTSAIDERKKIVVFIQSGDLKKADETITTTLALLDILLTAKVAADEAQKGTVKGKVTTGTTALTAVTVSLLKGTETAATTQSTSTGEYALVVSAGDYTLQAEKSGYVTYSKAATIQAQQTATVDISLTKIVATPTPTPKPVTTSTTTTSSSSTAWTRYEQKTVATAVGTFTVHVITADIGAGKARLVTDTANDTDCADSCPTLSVASYVSRNGGVAGMNGTYFCPPDYSWCAGQVNTFLYRIYNSRLGKLINAHNDYTANDPVIAQTTGGALRYFPNWSSYASSGVSVTAAMNSGPALVANGQVIVDVNKLDDKQRYTKSNRGALGFTGSALLAVVGKSATVTDMAYIMDALGLDYAMNLDGGGSSGMYYNGSYRVGPGRSLPNAVIIDE